MGIDQHSFSGKAPTVLSCRNVHIVASADYVSGSDWLTDSAALPGLTVHECGPQAELPLGALAQASLVILEVALGDMRSVSRIATLRAALPDLPVVAAIAGSTIAFVRSLVREGVSDVVALPFQFDELLETAVTVQSARLDDQTHAAGLAPLLAIVRSSGGCGTTTLATHLAGELAATGQIAGGVALIDLDLQLGRVAEYLGLAGRGAITDLIEAEGRMDQELVASLARVTTEGVHVFAAPEAIVPLESIELDQVLTVLDALRRHYGLVIIDLPANWTNWTLSAAASASLVLMVVELSVTSLRQAKRNLDLFASVGIERSAIAIAANRIERRLFKAIDLGDVETTLAIPAMGGVALDEAHVAAAQDQGFLVPQIARKSRFAKDITSLAEALLIRLQQGQQP